MLRLYKHLSGRLKPVKRSLNKILFIFKKEDSLRSKISSLRSRLISKILAHDKVKKILGANLAVISLASNFLPSASNSAQINIKEHISAPIVLTTQKAVQNPVSVLKVTQGFRFYHPGIDIDGTTGDSIKPIMKGRVLEAGRSKIGYGNYVVIDHENGYKSLYAHLSKIEVAVGQELSLETQLGKMGSTGRSTGDHLHLELFEGEKRINPLTLLITENSSKLAGNF